MQIIHQFNSIGKEYMSLITPDVLAVDGWFRPGWRKITLIYIYYYYLIFIVIFAIMLAMLQVKLNEILVSDAHFLTYTNGIQLLTSILCPYDVVLHFLKIWWTIINSIVQLTSLNQCLQQNWIFVMYFKVSLFTVPTLWITGTVAYNYKNIMNNGQ